MIGECDGSFWDEFMEAVEEFLRLLFAPVESFVETFDDELLQLIVGTPAPNAVFTAPTNDRGQPSMSTTGGNRPALALTLWIDARHRHLSRIHELSLRELPPLEAKEASLQRLARDSVVVVGALSLRFRRCADFIVHRS